MTTMRTTFGKSGWRTIGDKKIYCRSIWEANYARFLQCLKDQKTIKDWEYEPETFWFDGIRRGCVSYLPDFKVYTNDSKHHWIEVKGWLDPKSATKIKRFRKYYPNEELFLIDKNWFQKNSQKLHCVIKDWEIG